MVKNLEGDYLICNRLTSVCVLAMRPVPLLSDEELEEWGNDSLDVLPEYFGQEQRHTHEDKLTKETTAYVSEPVIGSIKAREEWSRLRKIVKVQSYSRQSTASLWKLITEYHREDCPNLATLAGFTLAHPIHTADCEGPLVARTI